MNTEIESIKCVSCETRVAYTRGENKLVDVVRVHSDKAWVTWIPRNDITLMLIACSKECAEKYLESQPSPETNGTSAVSETRLTINRKETELDSAGYPHPIARR